MSRSTPSRSVLVSLGLLPSGSRVLRVLLWVLLWASFWASVVHVPVTGVGVKRFGGTVSVISRPGFHLVVPWLQRVHVIDLRPREYSPGHSWGARTRDQRNLDLWISVTWRVSSPIRYVERFSHEGRAVAFLHDEASAVVQEQLARWTYPAIARDLDGLGQALSEVLSERVKDSGVTIQEVRFPGLFLGYPERSPWMEKLPPTWKRGP